VQTKDLDAFLKNCPVLKDKLIVLEKTENSELVSILKPCNKVFFKRIFSPKGPYWNTYKELGFGENPHNAEYLAFINNRMYFCKNLEKMFLYSVGPKKSFTYSNFSLGESINLNFDNLLLLLSAPFDFSKQIASIALASVRINEKLSEFENFSADTKKFWKQNSIIKEQNPVKLAFQALEGAVTSMYYSFHSSLAYSLNTRLRNSNAWKNCELEMLSKSNPGTEKFGFYSINPYDISIPRFSERPRDMEIFKNIKFPKNPAARWRENSKFLCARYLDIVRKCYKKISEDNDLVDEVFFLEMDDLSRTEKFRGKINSNKNEFLEQQSAELPKLLIFDGKWNIEAHTPEGKIKGIPAGGQQSIEGEVVFVNLDAEYKKNIDGKIVVSKTLSPNLVTLFDKIIGLVSQGGGKTSHTAVVSLEQGLPCIIQVQNFGLLKEGMRIRLNGSTGKIEKLE